MTKKKGKKKSTIKTIADAAKEWERMKVRNLQEITKDRFLSALKYYYSDSDNAFGRQYLTHCTLAIARGFFLTEGLRL